MTKSGVESDSKYSWRLPEKGPIRVLHVDDESAMLKVSKQCLEMRGSFQVETALSVKEALIKLKKRPFDVVVSNYMMPGEDGLQFLKGLREKGSNIPFIIFTVIREEDVAIRALNLGANRYFCKTDDPETLYHEMANSIRQVVEIERASAAVLQSAERLRAVFNLCPDAIMASDKQGKIVDCNEAAWRLTGFSSKEELIGKNSSELVSEKDRKRALEAFEKTKKQEAVKNMECTLLTKSREEFQGELSIGALKDSSGDPVGFVTIVRQIRNRLSSS
jgi:PAS domain S-box-containing protein